MSTTPSPCTIYGFFCLIRCTALEGDAIFETPPGCHTTTVDSPYFVYFETTITCVDGHSTITIVRAPAGPNDTEQPISSVAFLTGAFFIDSNTQFAYLDTTSIKFMSSWSHLHTDSAIFNTSVHARGIVCGESYETHDGSILFPVKLSVFILNDIKSFRVMYDGVRCHSYTR